MSIVIVQISKLPRFIQMQLPMSIRSNKDIYTLDEIPPKERNLIKDYLNSVVDVTYNNVYDVSTKISKYSDLEVLSTIKDTVAEYLTNYFYISPGSYPFDPEFGCLLKQQLQTKDTQLRKLLIADQINNVNVMTSDLGLSINVVSIKISTIPTSLDTQYECEIIISVPGEENIKLSIKEHNYNLY